MSFSAQERKVLLAVRGVGPTVVDRLEQLGIASLSDLAGRTADDVCAGAAALVGSTCWKNSPQARSAIAAAIDAAQNAQHSTRV